MTLKVVCYSQNTRITSAITLPPNTPFQPPATRLWVPACFGQLRSWVRLFAVCAPLDVRGEGERGRSNRQSGGLLYEPIEQTHKCSVPVKESILGHCGWLNTTSDCEKPSIKKNSLWPEHLKDFNIPFFKYSNLFLFSCSQCLSFFLPLSRASPSTQ